MYVADIELRGKLSTRVFQGLSAGKMGHPPMSGDVPAAPSPAPAPDEDPEDDPDEDPEDDPDEDPEDDPDEDPGLVPEDDPDPPHRDPPDEAAGPPSSPIEEEASPPAPAHAATTNAEPTEKHNGITIRISRPPRFSAIG